MPNLSSLLASPDLYPRGTGEPRGVVQVPVQPYGLSSGQGEQQLAQSVVDVGTGVDVLGRGIQAREAAIAAQRKAQDTVDAHLSKNVYTPSLQAYASQLKTDPAVDYRDAPRLLQEYSDQQIHVLSQRMTPQAAVLFRAAAGDRFNLLQEDMLQYQRARLVGDSKVTLEDAKKQFIDGMLSATTPQDQAQQAVAYETLLQQQVQVGLLSRPQAALEIADAQRKVGTSQVALAIRTQPEAMLPHLLARAAGQAGVEGLPIPPQAELPALIDETRKQLQANLTLQDQAAQRLEKAHGKLQDDNRVALRTKITELLPVPANLPEYDKLLVETNAQAKDRKISQEAQGELDGLIRTLRTVAANPPQYDNEAAERQMALNVSTAQTPKDFVDARAALVAAAQDRKLKPETFGMFMAKLEDRSKSTHYSQQPAYRQGRLILTEGLIPQGGGAMAEPEARRLRTALDAYDARIQQILMDDPQHGLVKLNGEAERIAGEIRTNYLDRDRGNLLNLPAFLHGRDRQGILDRNEAIRLIDQQNLPPGMRNELLRQWEVWLTFRQRSATPAPQPATPRRP